MAPPTVFAKSPIKKNIIKKILFFWFNSKLFSSMQYVHTPYKMCTLLDTHIKDFDPLITMVPRFFKSDKN